MKVSQCHRRAFLSYLIAAVALAAGGRTARAHARMVRSEPRDGGNLKAPPKTVELWFNELLDADFNKVELYPAREASGKSHSNLLEDKPQLDPRDRTHLTIKLPSLKPDTYALEYRVLSRDGHTAPGRITFTISGS